jgi:hypothetical protein
MTVFYFTTRPTSGQPYTTPTDATDPAPGGYLVSVAVVAVPTLSALFPLRRPHVLAAWSFRTSVAVNELPFVALAFLLASTALALAGGDVAYDSWGAWAGLGLAILDDLLSVIGDANPGDGQPRLKDLRIQRQPRAALRKGIKYLRHVAPGQAQPDE